MGACVVVSSVDDVPGRTQVLDTAFLFGVVHARTRTFLSCETALLRSSRRLLLGRIVFALPAALRRCDFGVGFVRGCPFIAPDGVENVLSRLRPCSLSRSQRISPVPDSRATQSRGGEARCSRRGPRREAARTVPMPR
jgi:hypothetical protein